MRRPDYRWIILAIGFAILFFNGGSRSALGLMLKPMVDDLEWSRTALSTGATVYMVVSAMAMPFVGRLADRYDLRLIMGVGAVVGAVGIGLMSVVSAPWQLFLIYGLVFALGNSGMSNPVVSVMTVRWFPDRRGLGQQRGRVGQRHRPVGHRRFVGPVAGAVRLAAVIRGIGPRQPGDPGSHGRATLVRSAPSRVAGSSPANPVAAAEGEAREQVSLLSSSQLWLLIGIYAICGFQDFLVQTHVVAFALDMGIGTLVAGYLLALMGVMGLLGVLTSGYLADLMGPGRPTLLCFVMRIGIFTLILVSQAQASVIAFALLYGFTFLMTAPLTVMFSGNIFGQRRMGRVSGTISGVHQISGGLGALVGALSYDILGSYDYAFVLLLALSIAATVGTLLVRDRAVPRVPGFASCCW